MKSLSTSAGIVILAVPMTLAAQSESAPPTELPPPTVMETGLELDGGGVVRYAISLPAGYDTSVDRPRPLVLALHPGGRSAGYGNWFLQSTVEPALRSWDAVMVAPDVPDRNWTTGASEEALLALIRHVSAEYPIDRDRVLLTGFSMGGRGAWHITARHPELFTGAIVMAGSPDGVDVDALRRTPLYLIHSPDDAVVPFGPVEAAHGDLAARGYPVRLEVVEGASHHAMGAYVPALEGAGSWILERWEEREP